MFFEVSPIALSESGAVMVYRFLFAFILAFAFGFVSPGCSKGSDIQLSDPAKPTAPSDSGTPTTSPKDPSNPTNPSVPSTPASPAVAKYRAFCDDRYPPFVLNAISSLAGPLGFGAGIATGELNAAGKFDPLVDHNLEEHENPQVVSLPKFGEARVLFSARRVSSNPIARKMPRYIFITDTDIATRSGIAKMIAPDLSPSGAVVTLAAQESLGLRTFGSSDKGRYLLIGQADGYKVLDSKTLRNLGTLKVGSASTNVNPILRESDMLFSVSAASGGAFVSNIYSVGMTATAEIKSMSLVMTVPSLRRPLVSIAPGAGESFASIDTESRIVTASPLKKGISAIARSSIANLPKKGRVASSAAFWRDAKSQEVRAAIVFENFVLNSGGVSPRYKIEQVFVRALKVDESKLQADSLTADFDYPSDSRSTVEMGIGVQMYPGVSDFRSTPDGEAVFGLFPGSHASQLYRLTSTGLTRVSQATCINFSIGREL